MSNNIKTFRKQSRHVKRKYILTNAYFSKLEKEMWAKHMSEVARKTTAKYTQD